MSTSRLGRVVLLVLATLGLLALAPAASAYPPGVDPVVSTSAATYAPGQGIPATFTNGQPGCPCTFTLTGRDASVTLTDPVDSTGTAKVTFPALTMIGAYTIEAKTSGTSSVDPASSCDSAVVTTTFKVAVTPTGGTNTGQGGSQGTASGADPGPTSSNTGLIVGAAVVLLVAAAAAGFVALRRRDATPSGPAE